MSLGNIISITKKLRINKGSGVHVVTKISRETDIKKNISFFGKNIKKISKTKLRRTRHMSEFQWLALHVLGCIDFKLRQLSLIYICHPLIPIIFEFIHSHRIQHRIQQRIRELDCNSSRVEYLLNELKLFDLS